MNCLNWKSCDCLIFLRSLKIRLARKLWKYELLLLSWLVEWSLQLFVPARYLRTLATTKKWIYWAMMSHCLWISHLVKILAYMLHHYKVENIVPHLAWGKFRVIIVSTTWYPYKLKYYLLCGSYHKCERKYVTHYES